LEKLGTSPPEALVLSLTSSNCSPILRFGIEVCNITKSQISNLTFVDNSVYVKTFSTFDKSVIDYCHFYMGYLTFPLLYDLNRFKFYKGLCSSTISPASMLFNWFGYDDLYKLG